MLPCMNDSDSVKLMTKIGYTIHKFIDEVENPNIVVRSNSLSTRSQKEILNFIFVLTYSFVCVLQLNAKMSEIYRLLGIEKQAQKILGVIKICEPFTGPPNYTYTPDSCPQNAIRISDLPKVSIPWKLKYISFFQHKLFCFSLKFYLVFNLIFKI